MKNKNTHIGFSNEIEIDPQNPWVKLVEYGEHPHSVGLQCFNYQAAQEMERSFKSIKGKLKRKFGGLPIYIGHPDDPVFEGKPGHTDTRAYGWIKNIQARSDAMYAQIKWSAQGEEILKNNYYKHFSPRWGLLQIGGGKFSPNELVSVGLTNNPNILGDTIVDEENPASNTVEIQRIELPIQSKIKNLYVPDIFKISPKDNFLSLVRARMEQTGEDYASAWAHLKKSRSDLYKQID